MQKPPAEDLPAFLARQTHEALVAVLLELAQDHEMVLARLARMRLADQPDTLAAGFRKSLATLKSANEYYDYRESDAFAQTLEKWLNQVERELSPRDPAAALSLFETFIEWDSAWFEQADDSGGVVGDAVREACQCWLRAAARCNQPADVLQERMIQLYLSDEYGARDALFRHAGLLLDEASQRKLVTRLETQLAERAGAWLAASRGQGSLSSEVFKLSGALSLLSESLGDPDIRVRATLYCWPDPNPVQRQSFARAYIEARRPADALVWLQDSWGEMDHSRQDLLVEALEALERFDESVPIRQRAFERSLSDSHLELWLKHLTGFARSEALAHARELALAHKDPGAAAIVLLRLGDARAAEEKLLVHSQDVNGNAYYSLVPLAEALRKNDCPRGEAVIYRALLEAVLERANARAYGDAAGYWARLSDIANSGTVLLPLSSHADYEAGIRKRHARKTSFWAYVNGRRRIRRDFEDGT